MGARNNRVYIDFEFCSLEYRAPISLGIVEPRGHHYFEFDDWKEANCSDWVKENVLPYLHGRGMPISHIKADLHALFAGLGEGVIIADNVIDHKMLLSIVGDVGARWRHAISAVAPRTYPHLVPDSLRQHHALDDAIALSTVVRHFELEGFNSISEPRRFFLAPGLNRGRIG